MVAEIDWNDAGARAAGAPASLCSMAGVGKRFGGTWACRNVDFTLRAGEVHALMGENGAGKSTLMSMLHGLHQPDEGRIEIEGRPVAFTSPRDGEEAGVAIVRQELDLFPDLTVTENLFVGRRRPRNRCRGFDWRAMRREAQRIFRTLNVDLDIDAHARGISSANAQMVEIARALLRDAKIILMDEPTAALTGRETQQLFAIIRELTSRGVGVIYVSHRLEEVFQIAHSVTVLRDGAVVCSRPIHEMTPATLVQLMIGRPLGQRVRRASRMVGELVLEADGIGRAEVFRDVSFNLRGGEIVGLAGLIGAGRSELAQAIFGLQPASTGEIRMRGAIVRIDRPQTAIEHGIMYVPEERRSQGLFLDFPVAWNIAFSDLKRLSPLSWVIMRREQTVAAHFRDVFSIRGGDHNSPVGSLSGGNQQKVLLAKCLATGPEVILLDEPTRGVDVGAKAEIYRIIDELAEAGKAVLLISSDMTELLSMSDRILVMHRGRLVGEFAGPHFAADRIGAAAMGVSS